MKKQFLDKVSKELNLGLVVEIKKYSYADITLVDIPSYNVELDSREEGKVNHSVIHVICDAWGYRMVLREAT